MKTSTKVDCVICAAAHGKNDVRDAASAAYFTGARLATTAFAAIPMCQQHRRDQQRRWRAYLGDWTVPQ